MTWFYSVGRTSSFHPRENPWRAGAAIISWFKRSCNDSGGLGTAASRGGQDIDPTPRAPTAAPPSWIPPGVTWPEKPDPSGEWTKGVLQAPLISNCVQLLWTHWRCACDFLEVFQHFLINFHVVEHLSFLQNVLNRWYLLCVINSFPTLLKAYLLQTWFIYSVYVLKNCLWL
jgi:hypothetical protein